MERLLKWLKVHERTTSDATIELRASQQLVGVIDVLLALILVEGALSYKELFTGHSRINAAVLLALALVYYTALRSFIDWHLAMEERPYLILDRNARSRELGRVVLDFGIMATYTFLLLRAHVLIDDPGADLLALALAYPAIYVMYMAWNWLQKRAYNSERFTQRPLWAATAAASILVGLYLFAPPLGMEDELRNILLILVELGIMAAFRHVNWQQQLVLDRKAGARTDGQTELQREDAATSRSGHQSPQRQEA